MDARKLALVRLMFSFFLERDYFFRCTALGRSHNPRSFKFLDILRRGALEGQIVAATVKAVIKPQEALSGTRNRSTAAAVFYKNKPTYLPFSVKYLLYNVDLS